MSDAAVARHLTAARDRDLADLTVRVDEQFGRVDQNFLAIRGRPDAAAAGRQSVVDMLTRLLDERGPGA